jgi:ribonuclease P protein subunit RPR2
MLVNVMSKRVKRSEAAGIAAVRIEKLMAMAKEQASHGDIDLARRYVDLARRIGLRTRTKISKEHIYCKNCLVPMVPDTFRVRLRTHRIIMVCAECGSVKRIPYLKEQRE